MTLRLNGSTSGYVEIDAPATAGSTAITIPATTGGEFIVSDSSGNIDLGPLDIDGGASDDSVKIDSSGRLLVGTSTDSQISTVVLQGRSDDATQNAVLRLCRGSTPTTTQALGSLVFGGSGHESAATINAFRDSGTWTSGSSHPSSLVFNTTADGASSPTERMRITSAGDVYIGVTSGGSGVGNTLKPKGYNTRTGHGGSFGSNTWNLWWAGSSLQAYVDNSNVGTFTFASDYRVKKNIETIDSSCLERVKQLRPVRYELTDYGNLFKADGIVREGFIAHEVQEVIPSGAEGNKDEENRIQNLRTDAIVAVLTKALQEAISKIETLETANASQAATIAALDARLTALEGGTN